MNISREGGTRVKAISIFISGRDMGSLVEDLQRNVKAHVALPPGYTVTWGGEFENQQRAMQRLRTEWEQSGKRDRFEALKASLTGERAESGRRCNMADNTAGMRD